MRDSIIKKFLSLSAVAALLAPALASARAPITSTSYYGVTKRIENQISSRRSTALRIWVRNQVKNDLQHIDQKRAERRHAQVEATQILRGNMPARRLPRGRANNMYTSDLSRRTQRSLRIGVENSRKFLIMDEGTAQ